LFCARAANVDRADVLGNRTPAHYLLAAWASDAIRVRLTPQ
tara:strand:+ start:332 stop:454 length:123 start_codon:yes stop_codon:yes gene_type:complete